MKRRILLLILATLFLIFISVRETYSEYKKDINVKINSTAADFICDAEIDNPGTSISNEGWAYFKVIIKNYDNNDNITKVPVQYNLSISNHSDSKALYRYLDASGNSNNFVDTFTTRNYTFSTDAKQSQVINVEVRTDSMTSENVNFKVDLNCYQISK